MGYTPQKSLAEDIRDFVEFNSQEYDTIYLEFEGSVIRPNILRLVAPNGKQLNLLPHFSSSFLEDSTKNDLMHALSAHVTRKDRVIIERFPDI